MTTSNSSFEIWFDSKMPKASWSQPEIMRQAFYDICLEAYNKGFENGVKEGCDQGFNTPFEEE